MAIIWTLVLVAIWGFDRFISDIILNWIIAVAIGSYIFYMIRSYITFSPLNGQLTGQIEFTDNTIKVNATVYTIADVKKIDFFLGDYYGLRVHTYRSVNPMLSQGVNNSVEFTTYNGDQYHIHFKIRTKYGHLVLAPFINNALKEQKIPRFKVADLIGEENII